MPVPPPEPVDSPPAALVSADDDGVGVATVGTLLFAVALVLCLIQRDALAARGDQWVLWTCASGVVVGVVFGTFARRRARVYHLHARVPLATADDPPGPDGS